MIKFSGVILACILLFSLSPLQAEIKVGVAGAPPFTSFEKNGIEGISVDLWKEVAIQARLQFRLIPYPSVAELIQAVKKREVDVGVGPISITAQRAREVAYTQPYFASPMGVLTRKVTTSVWKIVKPFLRTAFFLGVLTLVFILFIVGNLIWLVERKHNDNFPPTYIQGVGHGMWFAVVTFTTVGYGDLIPRTRIGRLVSASWMIVAMITASSITAGIATSFTLISLRHAAIESAESLEGQKVAVVRGTTGAEFARRHEAELLVRPTLAAAVRAVAEGRAEAVTFDYPALR